MPTMNVSLTKEFTEFVEREIASGRYSSASEVFRDGLRLLQQEQEGREEKLAILRREVGIGLQQAREGRFSDKSVSDIGKALLEE